MAIVINAIMIAKEPAAINTHQPIEIRQAKSWSHLFIKYHARGAAIIIAATTNFKKSFDNNFTIPTKEAPKTLRMPISLVRLTTARAAKPNKPRHARKTEIPPAHPIMLLHFLSDL